MYKETIYKTEIRTDGFNEATIRRIIKFILSAYSCDWNYVKLHDNIGELSIKNSRKDENTIKAIFIKIQKRIDELFQLQCNLELLGYKKESDANDFAEGIKALSVLNKSRVPFKEVTEGKE